jgi:SNF2 family DNA or RNA helicase
MLTEYAPLYNKDGKPFRPYQHMIVDHLMATPKCGIWSFMGSGKTAATLTAIDRLQFAGFETKPTLVIAPLRVAKDVWPTEIHEWPHLQHLRVVPIVGSETQRKDALHNKADIYTINFENLEWLIETWGDHWDYGMIVVDEATKLKSLRASIRENEDGKQWIQGKGGERAKSLLKTVFRFKTQRFIELSGTPSPNGLQDLWGQVFFLDYGKRLGRIFDGFQSRWFQRAWDGFGLEPLPHAQKEIIDSLKDIVISLKAEDWFDLSQPIERNIYVSMPPAALRQYREMEKKLYAEIQSQPVEAFNAGAKTQKCLQMASGVVYLGHADDPGERKTVELHNAKLDALEEIVEETGGTPLLVAYQFKSDLARLLKRFPKGRALDTKSQTIADWNAGKIPLLFTHPASAGHGLNLQHGSNILVYFSIDWNYENHAQIAERIGPVRQAQSGYKRNVYIYKILVKDTIEEDVLERIQTKGSIQDALMAGMRRRMR